MISKELKSVNFKNLCNNLKPLKKTELIKPSKQSIEIIEELNLTDLTSIIKTLDFSEIDVNGDSIFNQNNTNYKIFSQKFETDNILFCK